MRLPKHYRPELVASKDKTRPNLTDPYIDAAAKRIVATNGHALVALPIETDPGETSRYIARPLLKAARTLGDKAMPAEIAKDEIVPFGVLWPLDQIGRTFPAWQDAVPKWKRGGKGTITFTLNARLLMQVAAAMGHDGVALTVQLGHDGENPSPVIVQPLDLRADELGVLMPLRSADEADAALDPGQVCPACGKILASGAWCPTHGDPLAAQRAKLEDQADGILADAGEKKLNAKSLKGDATARKKGGGR